MAAFLVARVGCRFALSEVRVCADAATAGIGELDVLEDHRREAHQLGFGVEDASLD